MLSNNSRRVGVIAWPLLVGAFVLASCGGADDAASQSTLDLSASATAFVTRPPATTSPPTSEPEAGSVVTTEQEYIVQAGDYPYKIVEQFGVTLDDLVAYNEWGSANEFPGPGTPIKIPPGGRAPGAAAAPDETETANAQPAVTIPDAGDNCPEGEYTIAEGDFEGKVAGNFDVTVEALRAANGATPGYSSFYPGLVIVIPAKADC
jgi:LysM repeat protein